MQHHHSTQKSLQACLHNYTANGDNHMNFSSSHIFQDTIQLRA